MGKMRDDILTCAATDLRQRKGKLIVRSALVSYLLGQSGG
jgi:hypothetical protein